MLKPDTDLTRKRNYRPTSITNKDTETLNKIEANGVRKDLGTTVRWDLLQVYRLLMEAVTSTGSAGRTP